MITTCRPAHVVTRNAVRARLAVSCGALACSILVTPDCATADVKAASQSAPEQRDISSVEAMKPWTGDLDAMIERRVIRILTVYSKTLYFVDKGVQRGASFEAGSRFVDDLNNKLAKEKRLKKNLKVHALFVPVARDELLPALVAGRGDIVMSLFGETEPRRSEADFSAPLIPKVSEVIVSGPGAPAIFSADDLSGKQVYVRKGSTYYESLAALNRRFASEGKPAVAVKEVPEMLEDEDLIEMVNAGLIPLTVAPDFVASFWKQVFPKIKVHVEITLRADGNVAWAIRKDSPQLKAAVDDFAARNAKGTAVGNELIARYFKNAKYVKDAASESERKKFLAVIHYFQKYGDEYDVDWLLMAAQGYQESQLNQSARSPVGAIGIMQVMPATGKDMNVGDIDQVEPNIHAGVKYMRWMIDQYYANEPMTRLDKALFAFAAYNAGAGRISQLRKEAANRGLDPNVWFRNVEYVAADKIGAETVTYVSNIYKYYIAYTLIMESAAEKTRAEQQIRGTNEQTH